MTSITTSSQALDQFEALWQDALAQERDGLDPVVPPADAPLDDAPLDDVPGPEEIAARLAELADLAHTGGLIDTEQRDRVRRCASEQTAVFASVDRDALATLVSGSTSADPHRNNNETDH